MGGTVGALGALGDSAMGALAAKEAAGDGANTGAGAGREAGDAAWICCAGAAGTGAVGAPV